MRQTINPHNYKDKLCSIPTKVVDLIEFLQEVVESVPEDQRQSIELEYDYEEDYGSYYVVADLYHIRPPTEEELAQQASTKKAMADRNKHEELRQLAILQAKYGKGGTL